MTKRTAPTKQSSASEQSPLNQHTQGISPQRQQEQALMLEPFYERLIGMTFDQSTTAIERCRDLCAEFGFTVKQEASTHRNIYVYCSREGLPDSLRNPKSNPQRKRPSKRCDCRWRVVLYENENHWEFRKSLNPEAGKHNHELMRPEDIERSWPKEVTALICELARLRITTQDIRSRVRGQFPNIHWNERRFYNRLSEERSKIKLRDSKERTHQLTELWSKVCMATAGNDDLSQFVKQEMSMLFQSICETVQIDPATFPSPLLLKDDNTDAREEQTNNNDDEASSPTSSYHENNDHHEPTYETNKRTKSLKQDAPKGYLPVEIPKQVYYIKIHNQRQLNETELLKNQRRARTFSEDADALMEPSRKILKKGKSRQSIISDHNALPDTASTDSNMMSPLIPQSYANNNNSRASSSSSNPHHHHHAPPPPPNNRPPQSPATFVYYENNSLPLDSASLSGYVHQPFQNTYAPGAPGFSSNELTFSFDSSMRNSESNNNSSNEPTIHPALQSAPMSHQDQQQQKMNPIMQSNRYNKPPPPPQQQMRIIYESPKDNNSNMRSMIPDNQQYHQQQQRHPQMYNNMRPPSPHHMMPMYSQQQHPSDASRLNNMNSQQPPQ